MGSWAPSHGRSLRLRTARSSARSASAHRQARLSARSRSARCELAGCSRASLIAGTSAGNGQADGIGGAIEHAFTDLGWGAAVCLAGPALPGEDAFGLDCAAAAHALGHPRLAVAEMSTAAGGSGHELSEQTLTLLDLVAEPVSVALPAGIRSPVGRELREGLRSVFDSPGAGQSQLALGVDRPARIARHDWRRSPVDLVGFAGAGLPVAPGMPTLLEDPLLHAAALAAGSVLAELLQEEEWH